MAKNAFGVEREVRHVANPNIGTAARRPSQKPDGGRLSGAFPDTSVVYCGDNPEQLAKLPDDGVDFICIGPPLNFNRNRTDVLKRHVGLIICVGCLILLGAVPGQAQSDEISTNDFPKHDFKAWPAQIASYYSHISIGGYAFMARYNGIIVASHVGGYARMPYEKEGAGMRWTASKPMHVASVSKSITGTALVKLWEEKHKSFSFDAPFWPYVKDLFPDATEQSRQITLHQLFNHKSGLFQQGGGSIRFAREALASPTNAVPGTKKEYNNLNFYILRLVLEKISGEPYTQYVRNHVLIPCGAINMDTKPEARLPLLGYISKGQTNLPGNAFSDFTSSAGAVGWYASTLELTAFDYGASNGRIISKDSSEMMFREGFGWGKIKAGNKVVGYGHNGGWGWFWVDAHGNKSGGNAGALMVHFVDGVDAVILVNSDQGEAFGKDFTRLLLDLWLGNYQNKE